MRLRLEAVGHGRATGGVRWSPIPVRLPVRPATSGSGPVVCAESARGDGRAVEELSAAALILVEAPVPPPSDAPIPVLMGLPRGLVEEGDRAEVDADSGELEIAGVASHEVVSCFLERPDGRILLLRRSAKVGSFQGLWAGVSGYLESADPLGQALLELEEETGLTLGRADVAAVGRPLYARSGSTAYLVHPYRFRATAETIRLDWEHTEARWVLPEEIASFPTVPRLAEAWAEVAPGPRPLGEGGKR